MHVASAGVSQRRGIVDWIVALAVIGHAWFHRLQKSFADVI